MTAPSPNRAILFEARHPDGASWRVYSDGSTEGFPAGISVANYARANQQYVSALLRRAAAHGLVSDQEVAKLEELGYSAGRCPVRDSDAAGLLGEVQVHTGPGVVEPAEQGRFGAVGELEQGVHIGHGRLGDGPGLTGIVDVQVMPTHGGVA